MQAVHLNTPLLSAPIPSLLQEGLPPVYFKLDNLQPSGSFKIRGIGHLVQQTLESSEGRLRSIVSSSGGNAGLAAAYAAQHYQLESYIFCPKTTLGFVVDRLEQDYNARVTIVGDAWDEAHKEAMAFMYKQVEKYGKHSVLFVHPFDDPLIWQGHATVIPEIQQQLDAVPDVIVCAVGGGGLCMGIIQGLEALESSINPLVIAVETRGAHSFHQSWTHKSLSSLDGITSIATSLGAKTTSSAFFTKTIDYGHVESVVVSDKEAVEAVVEFANTWRMLVEPACGAALSLVLTPHGRRVLKDVLEKSPVVIQGVKRLDELKIVIQVCGGSGVNLDMIEKWKNMY